MERFSQRESLLLGYSSPQRSFANSASSANTNSDVDFHDVFGGPPRRSSIHEMRYSSSEFTDTNASFKGNADDDDGGDDVWASLTEKPVFGEDSSNRRRTQSDDFFDDIFKGNNSMSLSPRRLHRSPFSSAPGSRVLSPAPSLPPKPEPSLTSSLPTQFSLPARLTKGVDMPTVGSTTRTASLSRFSGQAIQSLEDLRNDIEFSNLQSPLSPELSISGEGSSNLAMSNKADTGSSLEQDSKSSKNAAKSSPFQFHFSIYKWASKGVPVVMPLRGGNGSRVHKRTKSEERSGIYECAANESMARQSPKSTLPNIDFPSNGFLLTDAWSSRLEHSKQEIGLLLDKVKPCQLVEEAIPPIAESEPFGSFHGTVEDIKPHPLLQTASCEDPLKEIPVLMEQVQKPELKPIRSLFFYNDLQQGNDERTKMGGIKESVVKGTEKSSVDVGSNKIAKKKNGKRSSLTNIEVDKASVHGSLKNSGDNLGRNKVKGKVKEFVKMFNQEVVSKSKDDGDFGSQRSKWKENSIFKQENEASISATKMYEYEELHNSNVTKTFPDASIMIKEDLKQSERESCEAKTVSYILGNAPPGEDVSASCTGSVPNGSKVFIRDADESFHKNFQIKDITEVENKQPQAGNNHEEIQVIDAKIRQWSKGKEGNIRSLLTTMQYILWPDSGWKTVPLVDIIEGNAVKRAYQKALLCLHPDKLQQKGAASHQKYLAEKVFDILQEAWNHFNSPGPI